MFNAVVRRGGPGPLHNRSQLSPSHAELGAVGGAASANVRAARASPLGIFCRDNKTGDGMGLALIGNFPTFVEQCQAGCMRCMTL